MENVKLLHFTATWCGPCKLMAPMVKEVMRNNPDIEYEKVDIDERPDIVSEFSVQSVPTFVLFKDDMPVAFKSGRMAQKEFEGFLVIHENQEG